MSVAACYLGYVPLAGIAFALLPLRTALLTAYLVGWIVLPVASYPAAYGGFTIELIGTALPAPAMLVNKAWVAPSVTLVWASLVGWRRVAAWRPRWIDVPAALWCLWPLAGAVTATGPEPAPLVSSAYLLGVWGAPWLLGRVFLDGEGGRAALIRALANAGLAMVPAALAEGSVGPFLYRMLYGPQPMAADGIHRYLGYRPLLLFEDGNQYGIVVALAALAGFVAWRGAPSRWSAVRAGVLVVAAVASQSAGAILLLLLGIAVMLGGRRLAPPRWVVAVAALGCAVAAPLYLSGRLPIDAVVRHTAPGRALLAAVRATGRGSIAWRVSQDQKAVPLLRGRAVAGSSRWDWWRASGTRPWGLALLIVGQFGLIGLAFAGAMLLPAAWRGLRVGRSGVARGLGLMVVLAGADALLNAFVFLPALVAAGAMATIAAGRVRHPSDNRLASARMDDTALATR